MHEASLVYDLLEKIQGLQQKERFNKVLSVHVTIGDLCGVDKEAFSFAFTAATENSNMAQTQLLIRSTPDQQFQLESIEVQDV